MVEPIAVTDPARQVSREPTVAVDAGAVQAERDASAVERPGRDRYDDIVDALTSWHPHVRASKIFGMPCLKRNGRVVCGVSRTGMVFKLTDPAAHARALAVPGAHLFDPSGRGEVFRQWVVVPFEEADEWEALAYESVGQDHSIAPDGVAP